MTGSTAHSMRAPGWACSRSAAMPASTLQPSLETVDVERLLAGIAADLEQAHPGARIEWAVEPVTSDRVMLRHILQNLVANACKFGGRPPHVRITTERDGGDTVLCVADNGAGFDAAEAGRLFELFHRAPGAGAPGHGVGLAVVKHLVDRLGGRVWAETGPGGSRFRVALPGPSG
ncbi:MAG: ATP-binding protein [Comamonadaceae bacterium]|nr:MAG: ATP-binding protein [Comamonadaceae bacterium]